MWKAIHDLIAINYDSYTKVEDYASAFNKVVEKLETISVEVNKKWIPFLFVYGAQNMYIVWAERQRSVLCTKPDTAIKDLVADLIDKCLAKEIG